MEETYEIIQDSKLRPFTGREGHTIDYFWTKAKRISDGVTIEFGGKKSHAKGDRLELTIEKSERSTGGYSYRELAD